MSASTTSVSAPSAPPIPPAHLHRLFSGTSVDAETLVSEDIQWVLSLSSFSEPQAFGSESRPSSFAGGSAALVLAGTWTHAGNVVELTTRPTNALDPCATFTPRAYRGRLVFEQGAWVIKGTWTLLPPLPGVGGNVGISNTRSQNGFFACTADGEGGLWLGQLPPHESLADFCLPTNPLRWVLAFTKSPSRDSSGDQSATVAGAGCFSDSGDVPGQPILCFTLSGRVDAAGTVTLRKSYERVASNQTAGFAVDYVARLEGSPDDNDGGDSGDHGGGGAVSDMGDGTDTASASAGSSGGAAGKGIETKNPRPGQGLWLKGTWTNEHAEGGFGTFWARKEPSFSNETMQIVLCGACGQGIQPGDLRWNCPVCRVEGGYAECNACRISDAAAGAEAGAAKPGGGGSDAKGRCRMTFTVPGGGGRLERCHGVLVPESVFETRRVDETSCAALVHRACAVFAGRPFLGSRPAPGAPFAWVTYGDAFGACVGLAAHLGREIRRQRFGSSSSSGGGGAAHHPLFGPGFTSLGKVWTDSPSSLRLL